MKKHYFCLLWFLIFSALAYGQQGNAGPDKVICAGQEVTIGNVSSDPDLCFVWKATPADPNLNAPTNSTLTVKPSQTTVYKRTAIGQDFSSIHSDEVKVTVINQIKISEVTFSGNIDIKKDDGTGLYAAPHWQTGKLPAPVCYKAGDTLRLTAKINIGQEIGSVIKPQIRFKGTNGYDLAATPAIVTGNIIALPAAAVNIKFPQSVDYIESFAAQWEVSFDNGSSWCSAGQSKNPLYVTLNAPKGSATLFYSVVHLGCKNAKGQTTPLGIFNSVWAEFKDRDVQRVDGQRLTYYKNHTTRNILTSALLKYSDGQCVAWSRMFLDILKAQGIQDEDWYVTVKYKESRDYGFLVKNWQFTGNGTSSDPAYPYLNIYTDLLPDSYQWAFAEANDAPGVAGQGNANPKALFNNHQFIRFGGRFYDPSYGTEAGTLAEIMAVDAVFKIDPFRTVSEAAVKADLNQDGDTSDTVRVRAYLFDKEFSNSILVPTYSNY